MRFAFTSAAPLALALATTAPLQAAPASPQATLRAPLQATAAPLQAASPSRPAAPAPPRAIPLPAGTAPPPQRATASPPAAEETTAIARPGAPGGLPSAGAAAASVTASSAGSTAAAPTLAPPPAPGGLTADQAAVRAAATSPTARARAEARAAAEAALAEASAAFVPRLLGTARYTRLSSIEQPRLGTLVAAPEGSAGPLLPGTPLVAAPLSFPVILDQYVAHASLQVPLSDYAWRLPRLRAAASSNARAAALLAEAARLEASTDARVAYYTWARSRLAEGVADRALAQARAHLSEVRVSFESGAASRADVLRVESQVASAELLVARSRATTTVADRRLRTAMHDESGRSFEIGEDLRVAPPAFADAATANAGTTLVAEALDRRLELKALRETEGGARAQAQAARAAGLPRLDAVGNATYARPNQRFFPQTDEFRGTWDAGLQVSWAPTDLFGTEAGQRRAIARAREVEAERAALVDGLTVEVFQALASIRESESALASSARGLVAASESLRVRRVLFANGRATSVELTDAETDLVRAELEAIGAGLDRRIAEARLIHATGRDVR